MTFLALTNLWKRRSLIIHFSLLNVKLRYKGTYLGFLWNALEPLFIFLILYVVFTSIRETRENFAIYLLTGILLYHIFTRGTLSGLGSLRNNQSLITTLNIGNGLYPIFSVGASTLTAAVEVAVFLLLLPFLNFVPVWTIIFLPVIVVLMLILIWGLSYFLSIINVYLPDVQPIWAVIIHGLFFASPIFWYLSDVDGILLEIHKINPVGQLLEMAHQVVVFGTIPSLNEWAYTGGIILGIFFLGLAVFKKFENNAVMEF